MELGGKEQRNPLAPRPHPEPRVDGPEEIKAKIVNIYRIVAPTKIDQLPVFFERARGNESKLLRDVCSKYKVDEWGDDKRPPDELLISLRDEMKAARLPRVLESIDDVLRHLQSCEVPDECVQKFRAEQIKPDAFLALSDQDLASRLGIAASLDRQSVMMAVADAKTRPEDAVANVLQSHCAKVCQRLLDGLSLGLKETCTPAHVHNLIENEMPAWFKQSCREKGETFPTSRSELDKLKASAVRSVMSHKDWCGPADVLVGRSIEKQISRSADFAAYAQAIGLLSGNNSALALEREINAAFPKLMSLYEDSRLQLFQKALTMLESNNVDALEFRDQVYQYGHDLYHASKAGIRQKVKELAVETAKALLPTLTPSAPALADAIPAAAAAVAAVATTP